MDKTQLRGHAAMFGANVMWGLMSPVAKIVMSGAVITPLLVTDFRIAGACILFWILGLFMPREHVAPIDKLRLVGAGLLGVGFNQGSFIFGVQLSSPGEASIITTTMPMWVMILAALILREPITLKKLGGILLGACGALLLVWSTQTRGTTGSNPVLGDLLVLGAQLSYALYLTLYKNFIKKYSLVTLMKWMFLSATVLALPVSISTLVDTRWEAITSDEILGMVYVVVCATFLSYLLVMVGQKALRPTLVGMYNYVQPIVASIVGVYLGLDSFTPMKFIAVGLIFTGVWLVTISKSRADMERQAAESDC